MKKAKLFMMLALLVMGVSNTFALSWNDGTFVYNTQYMQSGNTYTDLPDGEVAISLYLGKTKQLADTVSYAAENGLYGGRVYNDNNQRIGSVEYRGGNSYSFTPYNNGTITDDDGDGYGTSVTYKWIGFHQIGTGNRTFYFLRTHNIKYSDVTKVVIPATVSYNGKTYKVTAIQKFGFGYAESHKMVISDNQDTETCNEDYFWPWTNHCNRYLREIDFSNATNLKYIGDYAFMSCVMLRDVILPSTIAYLGTGAFQLAEWLHSCAFQNDECNFTTIYDWTFWMCVWLQNLQLPDGITEIKGRQGGSPLQYLVRLTDIRLPNSLLRVGPHFLCCAKSLETLTIPAKVNYIDGACFHGCENLSEVYLLGTASALQKEYSEQGGEISTTFDANRTFCAQRVSNCTFYTTPDYVNSYADHATWALIADNQVDGYLCEVDDEGKIIYENGSPVYVEIPKLDEAGNVVIDESGNPVLERVKVKSSEDNDNNRLVPIQEVKRTFEGGKWVTAIFAENIDRNANTAGKHWGVFGDKTRIAKMTSATPGTGTDPKTGKAIRLYHLTFTLVENDKFEVDVPYMFCPANTVEDYVMIHKQTYCSQAFREKMTDDTNTKYKVDPGDDSEVWMLGHYMEWPLYDYCFYFSYAGETGADATANFYRVPLNSKLKSDPTRCFWYVKVDGIKTRVGAAKVSSQRFFEDEDNNSTTGIEEMETRFVIDAIYDLNGRKLNVKPEELPKGLFIINGKKVMINK
ncbi:MAG: leucine-rich repeat domain-containing protein [Aeriscardovia sp.]|nr:leucine-rich repeat domain-containing protein [Aeriscardovia sp.]